MFPTQSCQNARRAGGIGKTPRAPIAETLSARLLRDEVAQTVERPDEIDDELLYLLRRDCRGIVREPRVSQRRGHSKATSKYPASRA